MYNILIGNSEPVKTVKFSHKELLKYFPPEMKEETIKKRIIELIEEWKEETENG